MSSSSSTTPTSAGNCNKEEKKKKKKNGETAEVVVEEETLQQLRQRISLRKSISNVFERRRRRTSATATTASAAPVADAGTSSPNTTRTRRTRTTTISTTSVTDGTSSITQHHRRTRRGFRRGSNSFSLAEDYYNHSYYYGYDHHHGDDEESSLQAGASSSSSWCIPVPFPFGYLAGTADTNNNLKIIGNAFDLILVVSGATSGILAAKSNDKEEGAELAGGAPPAELFGVASATTTAAAANNDDDEAGSLINETTKAATTSGDEAAAVAGAAAAAAKFASCCDCFYDFDGYNKNDDDNNNNKRYRVVLEVSSSGGNSRTKNKNTNMIRFPIVNGKIQCPLNAPEINSMYDRCPNILNQEEDQYLSSSSPTTTTTTNAIPASSSSGNNDKKPVDDPAHSQMALRMLANTCLKPGRNPARYLLLQKRLLGDVEDEEDGDDTAAVVVGVAPMNIYVWSNSGNKIIVCDVDGTITKSNVRGVYDTIITEQYQHCHNGICQFLSKIVTIGNGGNGDDGGRERRCCSCCSFAGGTTTTCSSDWKKEFCDENNGFGACNCCACGLPYDGRINDVGKSDVCVVYLSSRPLGLANATRKFLQELRQQKQDGEDHYPHQLPPGAFMGFPGTFAQVFMMELFTKKVHEFKFRTLRDQILKPFFSRFHFCSTSSSGGCTDYDCCCKKKQKKDDDDEGDTMNNSNNDDEKTILLAAFGNTLMDMQAYHMAGFSLDRMYFVNTDSEIYCLDKHHRRNDIEDKGKEEEDGGGNGSADGNDFNTVNNGMNGILIGEEDHNPPPPFSTNPATTAMDRKHYFDARGSFFKSGYEDTNLVSHILRKK